MKPGKIVHWPVGKDSHHEVDEALEDTSSYEIIELAWNLFTPGFFARTRNQIQRHMTESMGFEWGEDP